ncbi:uncharacterized protein LOC121846651 [Oncorhynchus tshawytscha]|uniref:uncharacterized protein LOC121846651 n=1 Tax=Oncorhynchus tshawytscha TaxID=74940 RepID=UPI001C3E524B|nr:uncharacterized protein LOC121846651 [Oncorhynchus tshawytscha]
MTPISSPLAKDRCPFCQYIPSKPAKYGIKSWVVCDAKSSYVWKMQVYTGKAAGGGPKKNQGMRVVLDLKKGLSGRNVTCDNFFTSYELGQRLLERDLTVVGTVRKNKAKLPPALLESKGRQVLSSRFAFTPTSTPSVLPGKEKPERAASEHAAHRGPSQRSPRQEAGPRPRLQLQQGRRGQPGQGGRHVQLQTDDCPLAPGRLPQHPRRVLLQSLLSYGMRSSLTGCLASGTSAGCSWSSWERRSSSR